MYKTLIDEIINESIFGPDNEKAEFLRIMRKIKSIPERQSLSDLGLFQNESDFDFRSNITIDDLFKYSCSIRPSNLLCNEFKYVLMRIGQQHSKEGHYQLAIASGELVEHSKIIQNYRRVSTKVEVLRAGFILSSINHDGTYVLSAGSGSWTCGRLSVIGSAPFLKRGLEEMFQKEGYTNNFRVHVS